MARASSVGISLFVPLYVNAYYISAGVCTESGHNPQDIKDRCRDAYVLAAELTGLSQLVALLAAPLFGFFGDRYQRFNMPLLIAALLGLAGYVGLGFVQSPRASGDGGSPWIFLIMALLGLSQIGSIVCSLGLLGRGIIDISSNSSGMPSDHVEVDTGCRGHESDAEHDSGHLPNPSDQADDGSGETEPLLGLLKSPRHDLKGSIAGIYSLTGGVGILILTKIGGILFDKVSTAAPFFMLAAFNASLFLTGLFLAFLELARQRN